MLDLEGDKYAIRHQIADLRIRLMPLAMLRTARLLREDYSSASTSPLLASWPSRPSGPASAAATTTAQARSGSDRAVDEDNHDVLTDSGANVLTD